MADALVEENTTPTGDEPVGDATTLDDLISAVADLKAAIIERDERIDKLIDAANALLDSAAIGNDGSDNGNDDGNDGDEKPELEDIDLEAPLEDLDFTQD